MYTPEGYVEWITEIKARVRATQFRAARAANTEVMVLYWSIGRDILDRQAQLGWGAGIVDRTAADLHREFPDQQGWSRRNVHWMRKVAEVWPTCDDFVHHVGARLPWRHITVLADRLTTREERDWYADRAVEEGWSRNVLEHFIKVNLHRSLGAAPTNFDTTLDSSDSDLAQQLVKDPYIFEHLAYVERVNERTIEQALMDRLQDTLMEFGRGMAFVGRQVRFDVTDEHGKTDEFVIDLLLYHIPQARYVVVELKVGDFTPAYLGQLSTYVAIVDGKLRDPKTQKPAIGILLCTGKNEATVRFALSNISAPIGVADYEGLPPDARDALPSIEELRSAIAEAAADAEQSREPKNKD